MLFFLTDFFIFVLCEFEFESTGWKTFGKIFVPLVVGVWMFWDERTVIDMLSYALVTPVQVAPTNSIPKNKPAANFKIHRCS